jgi:hypothetical protein
MLKRLVCVLGFAAALTLASEAKAQTHHGGATHVAHGHSAAHQRAPGHYFRLWRNRWFHNQELPPLREDDGWGRYPKYYGGFHSSHFDRVGIPHGDIGFRGPSIYWTPW